MAKYKPGKSGVPTRKIKEVKKEISAEKEKTLSDKDRIAALEKQLAILLARTQQDTQGGKAPSDADVKRAKMSLYSKGPSDEEIERMKRNIEKNRPSARGGMYQLPRSMDKRKGGGKVYTSQNKKYGGGIYPKMGK